LHLKQVVLTCRDACTSCISAHHHVILPATGVVKYRYFEPYFETCGGVNLPKVVKAVGSDGVTRKHLVKGRDDLRQDAVMQQVLCAANCNQNLIFFGKATCFCSPWVLFFFIRCLKLSTAFSRRKKTRLLCE